MANKRPLVIKTGGGRHQELQSPDIVDSSLLDATLTALAAFNTNGLLTQTAADTFTGRTVTGTTNQISLSNGNGVAGDPTVSIASNAVLPGTGGVTVPTGTTAQESGGSGTMRYDTTLNKFRFNENSIWLSYGSGTVTSFSATATVAPYFTTSVSTATTTPSLVITASTIPNNRVLGNVSGGAAIPVALTASQLATLLATNRFVSSDQTITAGGSLTLAHSLGVVPLRVWYDLVCVTAELGYTAGQRLVSQSVTGKNGSGPAMTIVPDATNLNIRFSNGSPVFQICRFDTGAQVNIINANWSVRFYADL